MSALPVTSVGVPTFQNALFVEVTRTGSATVSAPPLPPALGVPPAVVAPPVLAAPPGLEPPVPTAMPDDPPCVTLVAPPVLVTAPAPPEPPFVATAPPLGLTPVLPPFAGGNVEVPPVVPVTPPALGAPPEAAPSTPPVPVVPLPPGDSVELHAAKV